MRWGGIIVLLFIVFHLLQFTTKTIEVGGDYNAVEPYQMVIFGFSNVFVVLFYALAVLAVGFHLRHGVWSATQTLGLTSQRNQAAVSMISSLIAIVVTVGFLTVPFSVLFGILD
jgi:succinate dehydrogenase / fumarate reductase cytochrome b subunit